MAMKMLNFRTSFQNWTVNRNFFVCLFFRQAGGPVDVGPEFQKDMNESLARLQRMYGEGDLTKFPEFKFEGELTTLLNFWLEESSCSPTDLYS